MSQIEPAKKTAIESRGPDIILERVGPLLDPNDPLELKKHLLTRIEKLDCQQLRSLLEELDLIDDGETTFKEVVSDVLDPVNEALSNLAYQVENGLESLKTVDVVDGVFFESHGIRIEIKPLSDDDDRATNIEVISGGNIVLKLSYQDGSVWDSGPVTGTLQGDLEYGQVIIQALGRRGDWKQMPKA